jgi:hypothetical protein
MLIIYLKLTLPDFFLFSGCPIPNANTFDSLQSFDKDRIRQLNIHSIEKRSQDYCIFISVPTCRKHDVEVFSNRYEIQHNDTCESIFRQTIR